MSIRGKAFAFPITTFAVLRVSVVGLDHPSHAITFSKLLPQAENEVGQQQYWPNQAKAHYLAFWGKTFGWLDANETRHQQECS
jgi:hypothetical protein